MCVFIVFVLSCDGNSLAMAWYPIQGILHSVYKIKKLKEAARTQQKAIELLVVVVNLLNQSSITHLHWTEKIISLKNYAGINILPTQKSCLCA
jgi:hypothetical protein